MSAIGKDRAGEVREVRENECVGATVHRADYRSAGTHGSKWVRGWALREGVGNHWRSAGGRLVTGKLQ